MSTGNNSICDANTTPASPGTWSPEQLLQSLTDHLNQLITESPSSLPAKRLLQQLRQDTEFQDVFRRWQTMTGSQRLDAWKRLVECAGKHARDALPYCVRCGECCRQSSPTLHLEDLELLKQGGIPWNQLVTLRRGEPVRTPFEEQVFHLLDERIKVREKPGSQECVFLADEGDSCLIYENRPLQCRAQACWDEEPARQLSKQPYLTRRDIFQDVELLLELIAEHDRRCAFDQLNQAFVQLRADGGQSIDAVIELLSYEDHFRHFLADQLKIPPDNLELIFGRSHAQLVPLFGFRVEEEPDGTRRLVPDEMDVPA